MPEPLVSLILMVTEPVGALPPSLASLINQSWHRTEPIVVVPSAKLTSWVESALHRHPETPLIVEAADDLNLAELFASGAAKATGEHVAWFTSQDACDPRRIERQLGLVAQRGPLHIACSATRAPKSGGSDLGSGEDDRLHDLPWALLGGRVDPRTFLVPRRCLEEVGGVDPAFEHLFELDLGLRLTGRYPLVMDPLPLLRRGSAPDRPGCRIEARGEFDRLWRLAVEGPCASGPVGEEDLNTAALPSHLAQAYAAARETGDEAAEQYVLETAARQSVAETVTVVRFLDTAETVDVHKGPAGETILCLMGKGDAGQDQQVQAALEAVNSPWLVFEPEESEIQSSTLVAQVLAACSEGFDACLACADPVVLDGPTRGSLIPGTLFRATALRSTCGALAAGDAQFWTAFANANRIGALPGGPAAPLDTWLASALVDTEWYRRTYAGVAAADADPVWHYFTFGWREGRDPNAWFSTQWYLEQNPGLNAEESPLYHFVRHGAHAGCRPHPDFDIAWYSRQYLGLEYPSHVALRHFLVIGERDGNALAPVPETGSDDLIAALVDADWYRMTYPDVAAADLDPAGHYFEFGWREGRDPNAWFATRWYLDQTPALKEATVSPLHHFVREGAQAGCRPHPYFDVAWYSRHHLGLEHPSPEALRHFLTIGLPSGAVPCGDLNHPRIRARLSRPGTADRTAVLKSLATLKRAAKGGRRWDAGDAEFWTLMLASQVPDECTTVLVVCGEASESTLEMARLLGSALPLQEYPLFALIEGAHRLKILDRLDDPETTLILELPDEVAGLRQIAQALHVRRAVVTDESLCLGAHVRWLRDAGIPAFVNGPDRHAGA